MDGSNIKMYNKYETLGEIYFYSNSNKNYKVKLLCSRLLANHSFKNYNLDNSCTERSSDDSSIIDEKTDSNVINSSMFIDHDEFRSKISLNNQNNSSSIDEFIDQENTYEVLQKEDNIQDKEWYNYWEKNGEKFINETWVKQYGSCTLNDSDINIDELYQNHIKIQYTALYWKFVEEKSLKHFQIEKSVEYNKDLNKAVQSTSFCSQINVEENFNDSKFEFIYKYKHFPNCNFQLVRVYQALSKMGYTYCDQTNFDFGHVEYHKKHLIKSTSHLNIYRIPEKFSLKNENTEIDMNSKRKLKKKEKRSKFFNNSTKIKLEKFGFSDLEIDSVLMKYWKKRFILFSKFEEGVKLDQESWYSVTPEVISKHIAERCSCYLLIDPFCGAGGNIIQFAMTCELVIAIDKDPKKIEMARSNAELYGVADRIEFIVGDFFSVAESLKADVVFLSPPWGGPEKMNLEEYKLSNIMPENGGVKKLLSVARNITTEIALHLPKNTNIFDVRIIFIYLDILKKSKNENIEMEKAMN
ncbi:uncharacterized protein LOC126894061 isoform X2 [Daktulosphaira vitifoliae]|uniref:uncharacterized protein LOC126894061 isoform X2 n=1 Tax=Daktulosphaira vitifoliae TaxID=58002 RepID=UPI0021AA4E1E|nr:uncharacterized protein LOC126894061 isoform X2 [Daktulosphaira vitifoliae]